MDHVRNYRTPPCICLFHINRNFYYLIRHGNVSFPVSYVMEPINTQTQPNTGAKMSPKFFFLSLGVLVTLITSVVSFLNLAFQTLDFKFPDALNATYQYGYNTFNYDGVRMSIATLIIFFPIFLILMKYWLKAVKAGIRASEETVRKWMIYLVIFLSAVIIAVDLVTLVRYFVAGEITTRFILKVVIALLVAIFVGWYYLLELRGKEKLFGLNVNLSSAFKSSAWVILLIVWSFYVIGTPGQQRLWRLDDRRVQDLQSIQSQVITYWQQKEKLPAKLDDLATPISYYSIPIDPEFDQGKMYEYKTTGNLSFELCATFSADMPKGWVEYKNGGGIVYPTMMEGGMGGTVDSSYPYPGPRGTNDSWDHKVGRTCFARTIDKDMYPPYPKPLKQ